MLQSRRSQFGCLAIGLLLAAAFVCVPFQEIIWDGGFQSVEYRIKFVDQTGKPVQGVSLQVQTRAGGASYFFPVNEFVPEQSMTSDSAGKLEFHHVSIYLEFSGHEFVNLFGVRFGETKAPQYECIFMLNGSEAARVPFDSLKPKNWDELPVIRKRFIDPEWPKQVLKKHSGDWSSFRLQFFDRNGDGKLDREELAASHYFQWRCNGELGDLDEETEFRVVEKTITLLTP